MGKKEQLWERLAPIVLEREDGFGDITVGGATDQQGKDNLLNFISQELDKAREEVLIELKNELLGQIEKGRKYEIYGGVADYQDALHLVGNMLSKLKQ